MKHKPYCNLVLAYHEYPELPYDRWFPDLAFVFITHPGVKTSFSDCASPVVVLEDYSDSHALRAAVQDLSGRYSIQRILARAERDVIRAAVMRQALAADGLEVDEAIVFRNKLRTYEQASRAQIPLGAYSSVESYCDALKFFREHGCSVIKPTCGSGSLGVAIVLDEASLTEAFLDFGTESVLIQRFTPGRMYHLDGIWTGDSVRLLTVSRYVNTCLSFRENSFLGSVLVDLARETIDFLTIARSVLSAMAVRKPLAFHLEVFVEEGEWSLCEIACRPGGTRVVKAIEEATTYNLDRVLFSVEQGLDSANTLPEVSPIGKSTGWLVIPPRSGRVRDIMYPRNEPWISEIRESRTLFKDNHQASKSGDYLLTYVINGVDPQTVEERIVELGRSVSESITMEGFV